VNIVHSKTVKFITQLRHTTQCMENDVTQTSEVSKYELISQAKLSNFGFPVAMLQQNARSDVHSFPRSNADICATDQQYHIDHCR